MFVHSVSKKSKIFKMAKKPEKWDKHGHDFIIFNQATDKHGTTLVHITYSSFSNPCKLLSSTVMHFANKKLAIKLCIFVDDLR